MPRTPNKDTARNQYTARVNDDQEHRLKQIEELYGPAPSTIASKLLQAVAHVGPENYPLFMREFQELEKRYIAKR